jgi:hypothetical protein
MLFSFMQKHSFAWVMYLCFLSRFINLCHQICYWHALESVLAGFIVYSCLAVALALVLMFWVVHHTEQRKMLAYIAICSLFGSLTVCSQTSYQTWVVQINLLKSSDELVYLWQVISVKAVAIALKLSFNGVNQFVYVQTWFFIAVVIICCLVQLNYLNKVSFRITFEFWKYTAIQDMELLILLLSIEQLNGNHLNMLWL